MAITTQSTPDASLSDGERDLLHQLMATLRTLQYGSVVLTIHDGRLVEIQKIEKIRMRTAQPKP